MSKKILIIEDEYKITEMIKKYLEKEMFTVDTAFDGKSGLEKALCDRPNLVVLDLSLPGNQEKRKDSHYHAYCKNPRD